MNVAGIEYKKPTVVLLQDSGIGVAEYAARTCYDSFENSENNIVRIAHEYIKNDSGCAQITKDSLNGIESSDLLDSLAWVHHHHSIIEHATISYLIKGTSRGVLQEHARHRIQAISVRSTRYTMSSVINAYMAYIRFIVKPDAYKIFEKQMLDLDLFVTSDEEYNKIEIQTIANKISYQYYNMDPVDFTKSSLSSAGLDIFYNSEAETQDDLFNMLESAKKKRNVGDGLKHIVSDNWKVDMVVTFNIRSLKNYFDLRDSGAAWFQIQWLAEAMKEVTPVKYLKLIDKEYKNL